MATEGLDSFAIQEQEYRERTEADFLHLSGQHRTSKQNDCDLEGKTYTSQTLPGVTNEQRGNFFDKMVSTDWASGEKVINANTRTLVQAKLNPVYDSTTLEQQPNHPRSVIYTPAMAKTRPRGRMSRRMIREL